MESEAAFVVQAVISMAMTEMSARLFAIAIYVSLYIGIFAAHAQQHPMPGQTDPYRGFTRSDGHTSCCGGHDCAPAAWDENRGLIQLPDGTWVDPWSHVNPNQTRPALYFSFDRNAHACLSNGQLYCVFFPGSSASDSRDAVFGSLE